MKPLLLIILIIYCQNSFGQSIKGVIEDEETKQLIPYATVILKDLGGSFLSGTSSDENGNYFLKYKNGNYLVEVSFIGYKKIEKSISIDNNARLNFKMKMEVSNLDEVVIISEKTTVQQLIDKKVINVGKDILSVGGDAFSVLNQLSEIQVGPNENISLRGNQNVTVLLNGKPSPLSTSDLLSQISSSEIYQVEIITSPSAKYQANGLTGIINIITNKKVQKGLTLRINSNINSVGGYSGSGNISYGTTKTSYKFGTSYNNRILKNHNTQNRSGLNPFSQFNDFEFNADISNYNFAIDWFPNELNEFSLGFTYLINNHIINNDANIFQNGTNIFQNTLGDRSHKTANINSNYRRYFKNKKAFIEIDVQFSNNTNVLKSNFTPNLVVLDNYTDNDVYILNIAFDYTKTFNDKVKIETGLLWNKRKLNNSRFFTDNSSIILEDSFVNIQSTYAAYSLIKYNVENLKVQMGLRGELFKRNANLITPHAKVENDYFNIFPSLHLSYNMKNDNTINFGYNRRTSRPTLNQVNPIGFQNNEFSINIGNPSLNPEFSNIFEVSYQYKKKHFTISPSVFYGLSSNSITINNYVDDDGVNTFTPINNGISDSYGFELGTNIKPYKWLNSNINFSWNYEEFRNDQIGFTYNYNRYLGYSFRNQLKLSEMTSIDLSIRNNGSRTSYYYTQKSKSVVDIGVRQKILKRKGSINFRLTDIFNHRIFEGENSGEGFKQKYTFNPLYRIVYISFSYNFNTGKVQKRNKKQRHYNNGIIN